MLVVFVLVISVKCEGLLVVVGVGIFWVRVEVVIMVSFVMR